MRCERRRFLRHSVGDAASLSTSGQRQRHSGPALDGDPLRHDGERGPDVPAVVEGGRCGSTPGIRPAEEDRPLVTADGRLRLIGNPGVRRRVFSRTGGRMGEVG